MGNDFQKRVNKPERPPGISFDGGAQVIHLKSTVGNRWYNPSSSFLHTQHASPASSDGCSSGSSQSSSSKLTSPDSAGSHAGQSSHAVQEFSSLEPSEHSVLVGDPPKCSANLIEYDS